MLVRWVSLVASAALVSSIGAQAPVDLQLGDLLVPIHSLQTDHGTESWAATGTYKVSFHGDATFVPYLGEAAPVNRPWGWRTVSVRAGEDELIEDSAEPERWHSAHRYEYRHAGVTEAYDVRKDGLEQSFVIDRRPTTEGDLIVTGRVYSSLTCDTTAEWATALDFEDESGAAVIRYGAATVIDADGRNGPVRTSYRDGQLSLRVAASWLTNARFPITVDPLLTARTISNSNLAVLAAVDVVEGTATGDKLIAYTAAASIRDHDVIALLYSSGWAVPNQVFLQLGTDDDRNPRVAAAGTSPGKFCIVFEHVVWNRVLGLNVSISSIRYHLRVTNDYSLSTSTTTLARASGDHHWHPDVGGMRPHSGNPIAPIFLIAYQRESSGGWLSNTTRSQVLHTVIRSNGSTTAQSAFPLISVAGNDQENPSVAPWAEPPDHLTPLRWTVVWQERNADNAADDWNVVGERVQSDGSTATLVGPRWNSSGAASLSHHRMGPQVAGAAERCLVTFARSPIAASPSAPPLTLGHSICTERIDWGSGTVTNHPERVIEGPAATARFLVGGCAQDRQGESHWALTTQSVSSAGGSGDVIVTRVGYHGLVTERATLLSASAAFQGEVGGVTYASIAGEWIAGWSSSGGTPSARAYVQEFVYPAAPAVLLSGSSCSPATIGWFGSQQIGYERAFAQINSAPPNVPAILLLALGTVDVDLTFLGMPGCRQLVPLSGPQYVGLVSTVTNSNTAAAIRIPLPEPLLPTTVHLQWLHAQAGANPLNLVTTSRLAVPLVK